MKKNSVIFVAGHNGLVGSAIIRRLLKDGHENIITRSRSELDLTDQSAVNEFFAKEKPEYVFLGAAKVGGIHANNVFPAEFIRDNLVVQTNVIHAAHEHKVKKLLFLGSSCIYPKHAPQPMTEEMLLTSALEPTNEWYAVAKIAGLKMCRAYKRQYGDNFVSVMPTNLYGQRDNYHKENSHVLPALIRRFHEAKINNTPEVVIWGTGNAMREFLHVDDMADACVFVMHNYDGEDFLNIGTGEDITIREVAETIKSVVGYNGKLIFDTAKPDGTPRKLLNVDKLSNLGWKHTIKLDEGIEKTYKAFLDELSSGTLRQ